MTSFTYDSSGNLTSLTDPDGNTTTWTYNDQDQLIQETNPLGASAYYSYDSAGDLTQYTDYDGRVREFTYDANHDLLSETWYADTADADAGQNADDVFQYAYNSAGQIVSESSVGQVSNLSSSYSSSDVYTYDSQGRETSVTETSTGGPTVVLSYQYTGTSTEPSVVSASIDGTPDYQDTYQYDSQGDVTQITQTGQTGGDAVADVQVDLTYNAAGQPQTITRYVGGQLAVTATYSYDSDDNLTGLVYSQGGTTLSQYAWTYTNAGVPASAGSSVGLASADLGSSGSAELNWTPGSNLIVPSDNPSQIPLDLLSGSTSPSNLIASTTSVDGTANYSYDPAGQLTGATYSPLPSGEGQGEGTQPDESYSYDSNGNRTNTGYVTGPDNELLSDGTYNYSYDADGNRIERTNIATGAVTDYVWDNRDRLVEVIDRASAGGAITQDVHYTYDAENRWIGETVSIPGQAVQETSYAYCGNQIVLQFDGTSSTSALGVANLSHRYLWGPAVDQILAGEQVTSLTQPGNVLLPLTNNVGTVCDLAQYNAKTGTTSVVDHRVYDSFGNLVSQTNAAVDFLFGFTGRPEDNATGLQINGQRVYRPSTGDWMSQDPTGFSAGDTNVYRYCGNSPANETDAVGQRAAFLASRGFHATVIDSSGQVHVCVTPEELYSAILEIAQAGLKIVSMKIWGHGATDRYDMDSDYINKKTGLAEPSIVVYADGRITINVAGKSQDVAQLMQTITNGNTKIDLCGCGTSPMARQLAANLGNGAFVTGSTNFLAFGVSGRFFFRLWPTHTWFSWQHAGR